MAKRQPSKPKRINRTAYVAATRGRTEGAQRWASNAGRSKEYLAHLVEYEDMPAAAEIAELINRFRGDYEAAAEAVRAMGKLLTAPEKAKGKRGAKPKWSNGNKLYAWLPVEANFRAQRQRDPKANLAATITTLFDAIPRRDGNKGLGLCVLGRHDSKGNLNRSLSLFVTLDTAAKYHRDFAKELRTFPPATRQRFEKLVERAKTHYLAQRK